MSNYPIVFTVACVGWLLGCEGVDDKKPVVPQSGSVVGQPCGSLAAADCAKNADCAVINGSVVDEMKRCIGEKQPVGCINADTGCDDALHYVRDGSGKLWQFPNSCTPADWPKAQAQPEVADMGSWSACKE